MHARRPLRGLRSAAEPTLGGQRWAQPFALAEACPLAPAAAKASMAWAPGGSLSSIFELCAKLWPRQSSRRLASACILERKDGMTADISRAAGYQYGWF